MPISLSGSLVITGSITTTGVITMSGSIASASYSSNSDLLQGTGSVGFTTTASFLAVSSSQQQVSASYIALSGSYNTFSGSTSTRITRVENNYATTGSNSFRADQSITGSLVVSSAITAQTLVVQTVTSSIVYSSGSNIFGSRLTDTQTFTGSVNITGSLTVNTTGTEFQVTNAGVVMGNLLADNHRITGSLNITGSTHAIFGNVGIGTTSPGYTATNRQVVAINGGSAAAQGSILAFMQGGVNKGYVFSIQNDMELWCESGDIYVGNNANASVIIKTQNTERLRINGSGNVGIGTTTPYANLQVTGSIKVATGNAQGILGLGEANGTTINVGIWRGAANAPTSDGNYLNLGGYEGIVLATGNAAIGSQSERMRITSAGNVGIGNSSPSALLHISGSGSGSLMQISSTVSSSIFYVSGSGNIGIGTTTPAYLLDVNGTGRFSSSVTANGLYANAGNSARFYRSANDYYWSINSDASNYLNFGTYLANGTAYGTNPKVILLDNGNVGIGTTSPGYALEVIGTGRFSGALTGSSATFSTGLNITNNGGFFNAANKFGIDQYVGAARFYSNGADASTKGSFEFHTNSSNGSLDVIALGIASTGAATFSSDITLSAANPFIYGGTAAGGVGLSNVGGQTYIRVYGASHASLANNITFINASSTSVTINSSGNVGIATTSPSEKLEVYGSAAATSNFTGLKLTNGSDGGLKILFSNSVSAELASIVAGVTSAGAGTDDGTLIFSTAANGVSSEKMRITSAGNVCIGTTSIVNASAKLEVKGDLFVTPSGSAASKLHLYNADSSNESYIYDEGATSSSVITLAPAGSTSLSVAATTVKIASGRRLVINTDSNYQLLAQDLSFSSGIREIFRVPNNNLCTGGRFSIVGTGNSFVHSSQWAWNSTHNGGTGRAYLIQLTGGQYTDITMYVDTTTTGDVIICTNLTGAFTMQLVIEKTGGGAIDLTYQNADRTSAASGYTRVQTTTSISYGSQFYSVVAATLGGSGNRAVYSDSVGLLTNSSSDVTLKKNVENIAYGLNSIMALRPIAFNWIPENLGPQKEIGFIAQEVQESIPELIGINRDETLSLDYPKLTAVLTKAIQELKATNDDLQAQINELKNK